MALARGGTGACNAVNTALTTDAQLQGAGKSLSGALGLGEVEITGRCLPKSFTLCLPGPSTPGLLGCRSCFSLTACPTNRLLAYGNVCLTWIGACLSSAPHTTPKGLVSNQAAVLHPPLKELPSRSLCGQATEVGYLRHSPWGQMQGCWWALMADLLWS